MSDVDECPAERDGWFCTLPWDHPGEHEAWGHVGRCYHVWADAR